MGCASPAAEGEGPASESLQPTPSSLLGISEGPDINPSSHGAPERILHPPLTDCLSDPSPRLSPRLLGFTSGTSLKGRRGTLGRQPV